MRAGLLPWVIAMAAWAQPVGAQCTSNASSCVTCHETQGLRPVLQDAQPWHVDHGFGDLCASCHGGAPEVTDVAGAHVGLRRALLDSARSCRDCHEDAAERAERYLAVPAPPVPPPPAPPSASSGPADEGASSAIADRVLAGIAALLTLAIVLLVRGERRKGRSLLEVLRARTWSPYAAGALLGLVVAFSEVVCGRPLGVSGAFDRLAAYPGAWLFPTSQYYGHLMTPGITWQVWLIIGMLLGAFASSRLSGEARWRWLPDTQWEPRFGASRRWRLGVAFVGALLVQLGAGIAGGCTSGLAISGGAALAPGAFVFMAGMFGGGIPAAWLWYRGRAG